MNKMAISPRLVRLLNEAGRVTEKQGGFQHALGLWKAVASQATVEGIDEIAQKAERIVDSFQEEESSQSSK